MKRCSRGDLTDHYKANKGTCASVSQVAECVESTADLCGFVSAEEQHGRGRDAQECSLLQIAEHHHVSPHDAVHACHVTCDQSLSSDSGPV